MIVIDPDIKVQGYFFDDEQFGGFSAYGPFSYNYFAKTDDGSHFIDFLRPEKRAQIAEFRPIDVFPEHERPKLLKRIEVLPSDPLRVRENELPSWFKRYANDSWRLPKWRRVRTN